MDDEVTPEIQRGSTGLGPEMMLVTLNLNRDRFDINIQHSDLQRNRHVPEFLMNFHGLCPICVILCEQAGYLWTFYG